ncbi:MAG: response regulator [Candidatus Omnitrophica bacterium]|nr:response regulator [Candidatus Omnitrophota bacterium]
MTLTPGTEKAYLLVIDDDPLLTRTLKRLLEKDGYFVDVARDGYEGIKKAKSGFFHLVLCDIRMPGLDGLMTIQHIQDFQKKREQENRVLSSSRPMTLRKPAARPPNLASPIFL